LTDLPFQGAGVGGDLLLGVAGLLDGHLKRGLVGEGIERVEFFFAGRNRR
jgi:hypothetical protein